MNYLHIYQKKIIIIPQMKELLFIVKGNKDLNPNKELIV